jgi:hypothetical protein
MQGYAAVVVISQSTRSCGNGLVFGGEIVAMCLRKIIVLFAWEERKYLFKPKVMSEMVHKSKSKNRGVNVNNWIAK